MSIKKIIIYSALVFAVYSRFKADEAAKKIRSRTDIPTELSGFQGR